MPDKKETQKIERLEDSDNLLLEQTPRCPICDRFVEEDWSYCAWCGTSYED